MTDEEVINLLQIRKSFSHVLFGWGFDDKIKGYDSVDEILFDWVMWRVDLYRVRKNYLLNKFIQDIKWTELKLKVFQSCIEAGKFIESVIKNHVTEAGYTEKEFNTLMDTPVRSVTDKGIEKLKNVLLTLKKEQKLLQAKNPEDIMLSELKELKATVSIKYPR
jgi:DNA gyrase/topoisomerase IV subunit A